MISLNFNKRLDGPEGSMDLQIHLKILAGQFLTLYGESGAGKTSCLRILAGLMRPDSGSIQVNDEIWFDAENKINLRPQQRTVGFVFQDYALFPHMTVLQNLEFALKKKQNRAIVKNLIEMIELGALKDKKPATLSGGQKQRVALARTLVQKPQILLLDEPLAALDTNLRYRLQEQILNAHKEFGLTTIMVSHDIGEIIKLSDKVVVLKQGKEQKQGSPMEVFIGENDTETFKLKGEIISIEKMEAGFIIKVLIHTNVISVKAGKSDIPNLKIGDQVIVVSDSFDPKLYKIEVE